MRISVVTPSFNSSRWLKLCIASVADQGVAKEHIVQDGGSDDGTLDWLPADPRVRASVEEDLGMYDAINRGLRKATGDILAYLNSDEQYLPGALAEVEQFFLTHPRVEVLFADAVVVDADGRYLWHRKVLPPRLCHTWTCPLSTLTCATFFRRKVMDAHRLIFDPQWRYCGDSEWVLRLLRQKVSMAVLRRFTSVFTHTGRNLSLDARARAEARAFFDTAPRRMRLLRPLILLHHRLRRLTGGIYFERPFSYSLYTLENPEVRVTVQAAHPTFRWKW